ncbi:MAG: hypothetical protein ACPGVO_23315 [Spirulinaceae cyanobacterium]
MKVKDLLRRYQLKTRQSLNQRLKRLGLTLPKNDHGHRFATPEQIAQLDDLHNWLAQGGSLQSYLPPPDPLPIVAADEDEGRLTTIDTAAIAALDNPELEATDLEATELETTDLDATDLNAQDLDPSNATNTEQAIVPLLTRLLQTIQRPIPTPPPNRPPLYVWEQLEQACEKGWLLTSSQVKDLTGIHPNGDVCEYGAFSFQRHGKIGREAGWEVWKNGY